MIDVSPQADLIIVRNGERDISMENEAIPQFSSAMGESRKKADAGI